MPGVTKTKSCPNSRCSGAASWAEQTTPSKPESCASRANLNTCSSIGTSTPVAAKSACSMLVSTVTPIKSGLSGQFATASAAASIMRRPPDACISTIQTPISAAALQALATVLGMSWYFRSRKSW